MKLISKNKSDCVIEKLDDTYLILEKENFPNISAGNIHKYLQDELDIVSEQPGKINGVSCNSKEIVIALKEKVNKKNTKKIVNKLIEYGQNFNRNSNS